MKECKLMGKIFAIVHVVLTNLLCCITIFGLTVACASALTRARFDGGKYKLEETTLTAIWED